MNNIMKKSFSRFIPTIISQVIASKILNTFFMDTYCEDIEIISEFAKNSTFVVACNPDKEICSSI